MTDRGPNYRDFESAGWRGLIREGATWWADADPVVRLVGVHHEVIKESPSVRTVRVDTPQGLVFVRHMTALKSRRDGRLGLLDRFKWVLRPSRALRTLRVHRSLGRAGIKVAAIVLAARRRTGLGVEDVLVSDALDGENFAEACKATPDLNVEAALLRQAGRAIAEFHRAGFAHGDLLPGNMLVLDSGEIAFIDNERTRRMGVVKPAARRRHNLGQMVSRLMPRTPYWMMREFFDAYYEALGVAGRARRNEQAAVIGLGRRRRVKIDAGRKGEGLPVGRFRHKPRKRGDGDG